MNTAKPLHRLLAEGRTSNHPVCHDITHTVDWKEFSDCISTQAQRFAARHELRWLLSTDSPLQFAILFFALLHAGKQIVIPPNNQPGTLEQLNDFFDAIADNGIADKWISVQTDSFTALDPHSAIIDLYTSGSTGSPKRVRKTLAQFDSEISTLESLWGETLGTASIVSTAPHHHVYGLLFRLLWPISAGRPFDNITCAHPDTLSERLRQLRDCALVSSPAQLSRLPELVPLSSLKPRPRIIFSSGGPLPSAAAAEFLRQFGNAPTEVFGSTETGGIAWRRQETDNYWTPLPGITVRADDNSALIVCSPFIAPKNKESGSSLRMEDAIKLLPEGRFQLLGRLDRTVKIEEKRVSLPALETRLGEHPWVITAATLALGGRRQQIGAVVVLNTDGCQQLSTHGRRFAAQELRRYLALHFETILLPRRWRFTDRLPINERGKLPQSALAALFSTPSNDNKHAA